MKLSRYSMTLHSYTVFLFVPQIRQVPGGVPTPQLWGIPWNSIRTCRPLNLVFGPNTVASQNWIRALYPLFCTPRFPNFRIRISIPYLKFRRCRFERIRQPRCKKLKDELFAAHVFPGGWCPDRTKYISCLSMKPVFCQRETLQKSVF